MAEIVALCFDVIGTAVDWRGTITEELKRIGDFSGIKRDWREVAEEWAAFYAGGPIKSRSQLISMGRELLGYTGPDSGVSTEDIDELCDVWTRLTPWPDAVSGLERIKAKYIAAALTNLSLDTAWPLSANAGLAWNYTLSAESVGVKKPNPLVYAMACDMMNLPQGRVMMVAAHLFDLRAAKAFGMKTCYVRRRDDREPESDDGFDFVVDTFVELADRLNA